MITNRIMHTGGKFRLCFHKLESLRVGRALAKGVMQVDTRADIAASYVNLCPTKVDLKSGTNPTVRRVRFNWERWGCSFYSNVLARPSVSGTSWGC